MKLKDIALLAGVGTTAVSRYFNANGYLAETTREKIHAVVQKTGYRLNQAASLLKSAKPKQLAMVMSQRKPMSVYSRHFFGNLKFSAALEECFDHHYELLLVPADFSTVEGTSLFLKSVRIGSYAGIIFMETFPEVVLNTLRLMQLPYVLANFNDTYSRTREAFSFNPEKTNGVLTDYPKLMGSLFEHASRQQVKILAFAGFESTFLGYESQKKKQLKKYGMTDLSQALQALLTSQVTPTRFLASLKSEKTMIVLRNETDVLKFYELVAKKLSRSLYIVALDPHPSFNQLLPKLDLIIHQKAEDIGRHSIRQLMLAIETHQAQFENVLIEAELKGSES